MNAEKRYKIFIRDFFTCVKCGKPVNQRGQIAHRIRQGSGSEKYIKQYLIDNYAIGKTSAWIRNNIIDHEFNLVTTCSLSCNDSFNCFFNPVKRDALLNKIIKVVTNENDKGRINKID